MYLNTSTNTLPGTYISTNTSTCMHDSVIKDRL